jgi:3-dehydroquinate synthase
MQLKIKLPDKKAQSYPIVIEAGISEQLIQYLPKNTSSLVIITDSTVKKHYAQALKNALEKTIYSVFLLSFKAGEASKNIQTKIKLEEAMLVKCCGRDTVILALGGGVVGDLAGFIAATYMRGISYIQIPTTLLAMVDSSVGGKTAIDTPQGKNLIGAFWQPRAVLADLNLLKTLSKQHIVNGLVEALKIFLTCSSKDVQYFKKNVQLALTKNEAILHQLVYRAVKIKAQVVEQDEHEINLRKILNWGHTIGHAIEHLSHYKMLHGYAVALGILVEAKISLLMGYLSATDYLFVENSLKDLGIRPSDLQKYNPNEIIKHTYKDKKAKAGQVYYVLLSGVGQVHQIKGKVTHPVSDRIVKEAFSLF